MLTYIIAASINEIENLRPLKNHTEEELRVIVIDEGDKKVRLRNDEHLKDIPHEHFGPKEREKWFRDRFGSAYRRYIGLIPEKCHAETSFGFLHAYEEEAEMVLEIDDDVYISESFVEEHIENLSTTNGVTVHAEGRWYNTLENLVLNVDFPEYPRGHPYDRETRRNAYSWSVYGSECALNMGLWLNCPDFDALTIAHYGGLDGKCDIASKACKREKVIVGEGTYFALCSMNTMFKNQVVPAFYQLYMNTLGIDRFDDIWSGIFLKKIADHLGDKACLGKPLGTHSKRSRDVFKDLSKELQGMAINERLWRIVDETEFSSKNYADCYLELAEHLNRSVEREFDDPIQKKFMKLQIEKMRTWVDAVDKLS